MAQDDVFFKRLTKLFSSGPSIRRNVKNPKATEIGGPNRGNYHFNGGAAPFGRSITPYSTIGGNIMDRTARYIEYGAMEYTPEISTGLNVYADEACASDEKGKSFHVKSNNPKIKSVLEELFYDIINVEFNLRPWVRNLVKYGDFFLYNDVAQNIGIINVSPMPVNEVEREEGFDPENPYNVRFRWIGRGNMVLQNWQVTHFRLQGNDSFLPYGTSILESARRVWQDLCMFENAMLTYRVVRSPERRVFYIDVGNVAPNDIASYMEAAKAALRSRNAIDPNTGRQVQKNNYISIDDDYYIPVRGSATGTKIDTLSGGQHVSATEDVEYMQKKLFSALAVPRAYLGYDETVSSKATLAQEDIRFSRTITVIQKLIIAELNKLAMLHLFAKGFTGEDLINFELFLSNPSSVAIQQKLALWNDKIDIASKFLENQLTPREWIYEEILGFTKEEQNRFYSQIKKDVLFTKELEAIAVSSENQERQTTIDPFDTSNYNVPGANISKSAPNHKSNNSNDIKSMDSELISNILKFDNDGRVIHSDSPPEQGPIKATPYATNRRRNEKRRVGMGGIDKLANPDFKSMLDQSGNNEYTSDVYGMNDYEDDFLGKTNESVEMKRAFRSPPRLSKSISSMFAEMAASLKMSSNNTLLTETFDLDKKLDEAFTTIDIEIVNDQPTDDILELSEGVSVNKILFDTSDIEIEE